MSGTWTGTARRRRPTRPSATASTAAPAPPYRTITIIQVTAAISTAGSTQVLFTSPMRSSRPSYRRATARPARSPSIIIWWVTSRPRDHWCNRFPRHARRRIRKRALLLRRVWRPTRLAVLSALADVLRKYAISSRTGKCFFFFKSLLHMQAMCYRYRCNFPSLFPSRCNSHFRVRKQSVTKAAAPTERPVKIIVN